MKGDLPDHLSREDFNELLREEYPPDKTPEERNEFLRESADHGIETPADRAEEYLDPATDSVYVEGKGRFMMAAMDMPTEKLKLPLCPEDEWSQHIAVLVSLLEYALPDIEDPYDGTGALEFIDMLRLEVYDQIMGFENAPQLRSHLMRSDAQHDYPVHRVLGLDDIPHTNTIREARQERFDRTASEFVTLWARRIENIGIQRGYHFPEIDDERLTNNGGITEIPVELKRGYSQGVLDLLRDDMPIEKDGYPIWDDYGLHFDYSLWLCQTGGTPEGELENFADARGLQTHRDIWADAETYRTDIHRVPYSEWVETFDAWTERLLDTVYDKEMRARDLPLSIDTTNIPTWASETNELDGVVGTVKHSNTHYSYQILSAIAVSDGMPFQLAHEMQMSGQNWKERLDGLLDKVEDRGCNVGLILADADFASGRIANYLMGRDIDFIISYPKHLVRKHTSEWEDNDQTFGVTNYTINESKARPKKANVTLFGEYQSKLGKAPKGDQQQISDFVDPEAEWVTDRQSQRTIISYKEAEDAEDAEDVFEAENRKRWFTFISNLDVNEEEARALRQYYHYRWAIESAYADYKQNFLPTTRSTELGLRTYLYLFGMTTYNAWVAANVKARRQHLEDNERKRPPIRASRFMHLGQQRYRGEFSTDYVNFQE